MITNERQYRISKSQLARIKSVIEGFDLKEATGRIGSRVLAKAELDAFKSECEVLSSQIQDYEALKSGAFTVLEADNLDQLPTILIRARIAKGLSQKQLAERIGLKEQQIQRYESEEYASANQRRIVEVANALGLKFRQVVEISASSG